MCIFYLCRKRTISEVQLMHNVREHKQVGERQEWLHEKLKGIIVASSKPQHRQPRTIKNPLQYDIFGSKVWKGYTNYTNTSYSIYRRFVPNKIPMQSLIIWLFFSVVILYVYSYFCLIIYKFCQFMFLFICALLFLCFYCFYFYFYSIFFLFLASMINN